LWQSQPGCNLNRSSYDQQTKFKRYNALRDTMNIITARSTRFFGSVLLAAAALLAGGCATTHQTTTVQRAPALPSLSLGDVAKMVGDKVPDATIVKDINDRGLKVAANAADLDVLNKAGASKEVIDAILLARNTPAQTAQNSSTTTTYSYPPVVVSPYYGFGYPFYGGPSFSFGFGRSYHYGRPAFGGVHRPGPVYRHFPGRR
jgi:hypothetical protein